MNETKSDTDPKNLIFEAYRIDGITQSECRSIFLDWALSLPAGSNARTALTRLIARYGPENPAHPMTNILTEGLAAAAPPRRRGGWRSRPRS